jgi:hypothetical protein
MSSLYSIKGAFSNEALGMKEPKVRFLSRPRLNH